MISDDPAEIRATLRRHGHEVPARGNLSNEHRALYAEIIDRGDSADENFTTPDDSAPDSVTPPPETAPPEREREKLDSEQTPGSVPRAARTITWPWQRKGKPKAKASSKKPAHKWAPTASVIEHVWSQLAWAARPLPPLQRVMSCQAPMAGVILQDAAKGTMIDRVILQPVARAEERWQGVNAMVGPPVFTTAIALYGTFDQAEVLNPATGETGIVPVIDPETGLPQWNGVTPFMVMGLRFSLMSWLKLGQARAGDIIGKADELEQLGKEADELISYIFSPPDPGQSHRDVDKESRERAMRFLRGERDEPNGQAPMEGVVVPPSSAFMPARATGSRS